MNIDVPGKKWEWRDMTGKSREHDPFLMQIFINKNIFFPLDSLRD